MNQQSKLIGAAVVAIVAFFVGGSIYYKSVEKAEARERAEKIKKILATPHSPTYGDENATVEIVEFLDPECGTCRAFYPFVKSFFTEFPGRIKLIVRYAPFHENSVFVVKVLEAARMQNLYWETLAILFENQPQWGSHQNPQPELVWSYLPQVGLDVAKVRKDMKDPEIERRIALDIEHLKKFGVQKTPTFYVNGMPLTSFGYEQLREAVVNALKESSE